MFAIVEKIDCGAAQTKSWKALAAMNCFLFIFQI